MGFLPSPSARRCVEHHRLCSCSFPGWEHNSLLWMAHLAAHRAGSGEGKMRAFCCFQKHL